MNTLGLLARTHSFEWCACVLCVANDAILFSVISFFFPSHCGHCGFDNMVTSVDLRYLRCVFFLFHACIMKRLRSNSASLHVELSKDYADLSQECLMLWFLLTLLCPFIEVLGSFS